MTYCISTEYIIAAIVAFVLGYLFALILANHKNKEENKEENKCIHGYEDWDDCPVCGH